MDSKISCSHWVPYITCYVLANCLTGDEFDIVFLSTVRSLPDGDYDESMADRRWLREHLGFVTNPHQICVGITRAKFGLIIVGESDPVLC